MASKLLLDIVYNIERSKLIGSLKIIIFTFSAGSVIKLNFGLWDMHQEFSNGTTLQTGLYRLTKDVRMYVLCYRHNSRKYTFRFEMFLKQYNATVM